MSIRLLVAALLVSVTLTSIPVPAEGSSSATTPVRLVCASDPHSSARSPAVTYRPPVDGEVLRLFDPPPVPWAAGHRGVDLSAEPGTLVRAPASGTVTFAGTVVDRGVVTVLHADGLRSSLEPVEPLVAEQQHVQVGEAIGVLTARPHHPGLHWGVRRGQTYLDPLSLLPRSDPVVLLP